MDNQAWHQRFVLQTLWTKPLRTYLYKKLSLTSNSKILDLGCGTGALLPENLAITPYTFGVDFDFSRSHFAKQHNPTSKIINGNAYSIPFEAKSFDLCFCHYLLLWIGDPVEILSEMRRVTRPGGTVIAFAEPDYEARIDFPEIFKIIGKFQNQSLKQQGVQLDVGRRLKSLFQTAGFKQVTIGMLSGEWKDKSIEQFELEWQIIAYDLAFVLPQIKIVQIKSEAIKAWQNNHDLSFIPTFYAWAKID